MNENRWIWAAVTEEHKNKLTDLFQEFWSNMKTVEEEEDDREDEQVNCCLKMKLVSFKQDVNSRT